MAEIQVIDRREQARDSVLNKVDAITDLVETLGTMTDKLIVLQAEVQANTDGVFENPADLTWLNAKLLAARTLIQDYSNSL